MRLLAALFLVGTLCLGCRGNDSPRLLVFAASSLTDSLQPLAQLYKEQTGVAVDLSFGASNSLARQISRGAPADVLVSAGLQPIDRLTSEGLAAPDSRRDLLANRLAMVTANEATAPADLQELANGEASLAIADPDLAPAGGYAREALRHLGLWDTLQPRLVYGPNVRATLGYVESGNVAAALVYATDAIISDGVSVAALLPQDSHPPIIYPGIVLARSSQQMQATAFLDFLASKDASQLFREMSFTPIAAMPVP